MSRPSHAERLAQLGIRLPEVPTPVGAYLPAVRVGDIVYTAGQLPLDGGVLTCTGLVGADATLEEAAAAARVAAINAVAAVVDVIGGINAIGGVVKLVVYVASAPGFVDQAAVANGASDLMGEIFGPAGRHARSAVGVAMLPKNAAVEVELVAQVHSTPTIHPI